MTSILQILLNEWLERFEDYCLSKAMDEAQESQLLDREAALAFLDD